MAANSNPNTLQVGYADGLRPWRWHCWQRGDNKVCLSLIDRRPIATTMLTRTSLAAAHPQLSDVATAVPACHAAGSAS